MTSHSRGARRPEFCKKPSPPRNRGGAGKDRVRAAPAVSCARCASKKTHMSIQVQRKHSGLPRAWLYGLSRALPGVAGLSCHHRLRSRLSPLADLTPTTGASGPHDFAVRFSCARQSQPQRPPRLGPRSRLWPAPLWAGSDIHIQVPTCSSKAQNQFSEGAGQVFADLPDMAFSCVGNSIRSWARRGSPHLLHLVRLSK